MRVFNNTPLVLFVATLLGFLLQIVFGVESQKLIFLIITTIHAVITPILALSFEDEPYHLITIMVWVGSSLMFLFQIKLL